MPPGTRRSGTSTVSAGMVIVGEHFQREEKIGFERLIVEYPHLNAWAGVLGVSM